MNLIAGRILSLAILLLLIFLMYWTSARAKRGKIPEMRALPGLDAIEEGVGRAAEIGKPIHYSVGTGSYIVERTGFAMDITAGLDLLAYTSVLAAKYNTEVVVTAMSPDVLGMAEEAVKSAFERAGKSEFYKPENMFYFPRGDYWQSGVLALFAERNFASSYYIGPFWGEAVLVAEAGFRAGAFQVAGCARYPQVPFFLVSCDYTMIGEEMFAAAAKASGDKGKLAQIQAQDITKLISLGLALIGLVAALSGDKLVAAILKT